MLPSSSPPQSPAVGGGVWSCGCLNWSLHCQEVQPCQLLTAPDDPFFATGVARAKLAPQGITKRHGFLERRRLVGEWEVHGCRGCQQDVYAASSSGDLLLSAQLEGDGSRLEALRASADFSPCFHIVLPARPPQGPSTQPAAAGQQQAEEGLSARLAVQELASRFLQQELEAMEARLRLYQEQQAQALERLRVRTGRDREALCQLLSSTTPAASDGTGLASTSSSSGARQKAPGRTGREHRRREDEVFRLDGFEDDEAAFPSSEEEEEEGDSDAEGAGGVSSGSSSSALDEPPVRHIAYSLPVDMPGWRLRDDDRHQQQQYAVEHDRIGADIEALARSVCDGTEMFGDLPRPRLNSTHRALF
ncbi:proline-rich Akt substrate 40 kDa isoform X2 [Haemaphysalis longicornis]